MTLIIAAANSKNAILASDRRLTLPDGTVVHEETCKLTVYACSDAKVMIAYTGKASTGTDSTGNWILNTLSAVSKGAPSIYSVINNFTILANSEYENISHVLGEDFVVEIILVGFYYSGSGAEPKIWKISNLDSGKKFTLYSCGSDNDVVYLELAGNTRGVSDIAKREIKSLLLLEKPAHGIEMKLVNVIRVVSNDKKSLTVGKQINSCFLTSSLNSEFTATYHSDMTQQTMYAVNGIFAVAEDGDAWVFKDATLTAGNDNPPATVPKAKDSQKCPCGSGEKYKHCHAKIKYPHLPIFFQDELKTPLTLSSGSRFTVRCYGAY